ncbi:MAG TPA: hypothetical protein PLV92_11265, partial [Pirellulaceae bacterium]|nr:hypothetical protein [Pirellulaceae bacterium]
GLPSQIKVTGLKAIPDERLRKALASDGPLGWASLPLAPLSEFLDVLRQRAIVGLAHDGFPEARVDVRLDRETRQVLVVVDEGPRYLAGEVRVSGGSPEVRKHLAKWLTESQPPVDALPEFADTPQGPKLTRWVNKDGAAAELVKPQWKRGKPVPFDAFARERFNTDAKRAISELRGDSPRLRLEIEPSDRPGTADLVIEILDEGRPAVVREILLNDGARDSREDVLAYLGLFEGQTVLPSDRMRWEQMLRLSGRYRSQTIQMRRLFGRDEVAVQIDVVEYPPASPLAKSLTRAEQTVLKCREWLMRMGERGDEHRYFCSGSIGDRHNELEVVLAPDRGFVASFKTTKRGGRGAADSVDSVSVALTNERFVVYLPTIGKRFELPLASSAQLILSLETALVAPTDGKAAYGPDEKPFNFKFGAGVKSIDEGESKAPVEMKFVLEPVFFLAQLYENQAKVEWKGDVLQIRSRSQQLRIDSKTGRLVDLTDLKSDSAPASDKVSVWSTGAGNLARRLTQLDAAGSQNMFDPARPVSSPLAFVRTAMQAWKTPVLEMVAAEAEAAETDEQRETLLKKVAGMTDVARVIEIVTRIAADGQLRDVDEAVLAWSKRDDDEEDYLTIPAKPDEGVNQLMRAAAGFCLRGMDQAFERDSWPSMAGRALACMLCGENRYVGPEMQRLFWNSDIGPLGCMLVSRWVPDQRAQLAFAQRGLDLLTVENFQRERSALLTPLERAGCMRVAVSALRRLKADEARDLGRILFKDDQSLAAVTQRLRSAPNDAAAEKALTDVLDMVWKDTLSERVRVTLVEQVRQFAARPDDPANKNR